MLRSLQRLMLLQHQETAARLNCLILNCKWLLGQFYTAPIISNSFCFIKRSLRCTYNDVGSLGYPAQSRNIARAGVVNIEPGNVEVQAINVQYGANPVVDMIDKLHYPDANNIKKYFYGVW